MLVDSSGNGHHGKIVGATWVKEVGEGQFVPYDADRRAAEWVLGEGGRVTVHDGKQEYERLGDVADLPDEAFSLTEVHMYESSLGDDDLENLEGLTRLGYLYIPNKKVTDDGLKRIAQWKSIGRLDIRNTSIGDEGLKHLAALDRLWELRLDGTNVTDKGMESVARLGQLKTLSFNGCNVSDEGLKHVAELASLKRLLISHTQVTAEGVKALQKVLPDCHITHESIHTSNPAAPLPAKAPFDNGEAKGRQAAWAKYLGVPVETTNSIGMKMRVIPPGEFMMGTKDKVATLVLQATKGGAHSTYIDALPKEAPRHAVTLSRPFALSAHEVTRGQFRKFVEATGHKTDPEINDIGGTGIENGKWVRRSQI